MVTMLSTYLESTVPKRVSKSCGEGRLSTPERWAEASLCSSKLLQTRILQKATVTVLSVLLHLGNSLEEPAAARAHEKANRTQISSEDLALLAT